QLRPVRVLGVTNADALAQLGDFHAGSAVSGATRRLAPCGPTPTHGEDRKSCGEGERPPASAGRPPIEPTRSSRLHGASTTSTQSPAPSKGRYLWHEQQRFRSATSAANASRDTTSFGPSGSLESRRPIPEVSSATSTQLPPFPELRDDLRHAALLRPIVIFLHDATEDVRRLFHRQSRRFDRLVARDPMFHMLGTFD